MHAPEAGKMAFNNWYIGKWLARRFSFLYNFGVFRDVPNWMIVETSVWRNGNFTLKDFLRQHPSFRYSQGCAHNISHNSPQIDPANSRLHQGVEVKVMSHPGLQWLQVCCEEVLKFVLVFEKIAYSRKCCWAHHFTTSNQQQIYHDVARGNQSTSWNFDIICYDSYFLISNLPSLKVSHSLLVKHDQTLSGRENPNTRNATSICFYNSQGFTLPNLFVGLNPCNWCIHCVHQNMQLHNILGCPNMRPPGLIFGHQVVRSWSCSINLCLEDLQKKDHLRIPSNPSEGFRQCLGWWKHWHLACGWRWWWWQLSLRNHGKLCLQSFYHHEHKQTH